MIKLTIIGAGSAVFTKNIVVDLMHISQFKKMHISLMDIDEGRLKLAKELIDTVSKKLDAYPKVTLHTDRKEALRNADFVQTTIQVGGYKPATEKDTGKRIPILQDLSGPKIRIGNFNDEVVTLEEGNTFTLTTQSISRN